MGIFDIFKKKEEEPDYDVTNLSIVDLDLDFVFDYNLESWIVKEGYEYDWGDNYFTREFKVENGKQTAYLHLDHDDELIISLTTKIRLAAIGENLQEFIMQNQTPPQKIDFEGRTYFLDGEHPGYFNSWNDDPDNWIEFISWDFVDKSGEYILCIEQWGESEFEAAFGKVIKEYEITNVIPSK